MDKIALVDEQYDEGKKLIEELDRQGKHYPIILWMNEPEKADWVLLFGVPKLNTNGAKKVFKTMQHLILENHINISLNSITLIDTTSQLCRDLRVMITTGNKVGKTAFFGNIINGRRFPDSIIYRVS